MRKELDELPEELLRYLNELTNLCLKIEKLRQIQIKKRAREDPPFLILLSTQGDDG